MTARECARLVFWLSVLGVGFATMTLGVPEATVSAFDLIAEVPRALWRTVTNWGGAR